MLTSAFETQSACRQWKDLRRIDLKPNSHPQQLCAAATVDLRGTHQFELVNRVKSLQDRHLHGRSVMEGHRLDSDPEPYLQQMRAWRAFRPRP